MEPAQNPPAEQSSASTAFPVVRTSILRKIIRESVLIAGTAVAIISLLSIIAAQSFLEQRTLSQVASVATGRRDVLETTIQRDRERTSAVASLPEIRAILTGDTSESLGLVSGQLRAQGMPLLGMSLFDSTGELVANDGLGIDQPMLRSTTTLAPVIDQVGAWRGYDISSPVYDVHGELLGYLALRLDAAPLLSTVFGSLSLGSDAELILGRQVDGELSLLHHILEKDSVRTFSLGTPSQTSPEALFLQQAISGQQGEGILKDSAGRKLIAATRLLPSVGWGLMAAVDRASILAPVRTFAFQLLIISILLIVASVMLGYFLARSLASPLQRLTNGLHQLNPGNWTFRRSVHSGDEVEVLDYVIADLTGRLKKTYDHLEELVAQRTEELRKEYALDKAILESIEYGVLPLDAEGRITDANPAALELLGYQSEEIIGKPGRDILQVMQKKVRITDDNHPVLQCLRTQEPYRSSATMHLSLLKKDQTLLPVILMVSPLLHGGKMLGAIVIFQDMTEDRQIDYMKSEFITLASHQLRTPLSAVRWNLELFGEEGTELTESQKEYLNEISDSSRRMAAVLDELLHAARLEEGGYAYEKQQVNVNTLLKRTVEDNDALARASKVKLQLFVSRPDIDVRTDPILLQIVMQNLVANAIKYSHENSSVSIRLEDKGEHITIEVQDTGVGIPITEQQRVFQKFFRAHNVRQKVTDGTGLGLYISKRSIESLGGSVSFVSEEGKGTTFTVVLPVK